MRISRKTFPETCIAIALAFALPVIGAARTSIEILIDVDDDSATGAVVTTARGPLFGVDERLRLVVDGNAATLLPSRLPGGAIVRNGFTEVSLRIEMLSVPRVTLLDNAERFINFDQEYDGELLRLRVPLTEATVAPSATKIWYVRNTAGPPNDGTAAAPFNRLASAQFASAPGDIIYLYAGDGTIGGHDIGFVLKDGQSLIGEGVPLVVDGVTIVPAGQKPMITNLAGHAIVLANNNVIRGLTIIEPKGPAIIDDGGSVSGFTLDNVTILRPAGEAVRLTHATGAVTISGSEFNGGPGELVKIDTASNLSVEVRNSKFLNTAPPSGDDGIQFIGGGSGAIRFVATGNTFQGLHGQAIDIGGRGVVTDAFTLDVELTGNSFLNRFSSANERGTNGVSIKAQEHELITVSIADNTFNTVGGSGAIALHADDSGTLRGRVSANRFVAVDANAIDVAADETTRLDLTIEDNTIQVARSGIVVVAFPENPDVTVAIRKNRISQTQREGVAVTRFGGTMRASLSGNEVSSSGGTGFALANNAPGLFTLTGDSSKSAQENLQRNNTGSVSSSGTISIVAARRRSVRR